MSAAAPCRARAPPYAGVRARELRSTCRASLLNRKESPRGERLSAAERRLTVLSNWARKRLS